MPSIMDAREIAMTPAGAADGAVEARVVMFSRRRRRVQGERVDLSIAFANDNVSHSDDGGRRGGDAGGGALRLSLVDGAGARR
jgi:hypothetical protein